jgi:hypothetical protein
MSWGRIETLGKTRSMKESIDPTEENAGPSICCLGTFSLVWSCSCRLCGETVQTSRWNLERLGPDPWAPFPRFQRQWSDKTTDMCLQKQVGEREVFNDLNHFIGTDLSISLSQSHYTSTCANCRPLWASEHWTIFTGHDGAYSYSSRCLTACWLLNLS